EAERRLFQQPGIKIAVLDAADNVSDGSQTGAVEEWSKRYDRGRLVAGIADLEHGRRVSDQAVGVRGRSLHKRTSGQARSDGGPSLRIERDRLAVNLES